MNPPRFLLGLGLALWGSCADVLWLGVLLGALVEVLRAVDPRLSFATADFNRVADLGTLLSIGVIGYFVATLGLSQGVLRAVDWLPVAVVPVLLAQLASAAGRLRMRNLFYSLRKSELPEADRPIDIAYPYFALCLISASIAVRDYATFAPVAALLVAFALFAVRARGRAIWAWGIAMTIGLGLGAATAAGIKGLQLVLEDIAFEWLVAKEQDSYRATTRIGDVGRIKLSDAIVWRVRTERPIGELLLVEAAYTIYDAGAWRAPVERFVPLATPAQGRTWMLGAPAGRLEHIEMSGYTDAGGALLALPSGTRSVADIAANVVARNSLGAVKVVDAAPYLRFGVAYAPGVNLQPAPSPIDRRIPRQMIPVLEEALGGMRAPAGDAAEAVRIVRRFFGDRFRYSLYLGDESGGKSLRNFLLESRSGHCEYYATATTLLLRSLGVHARYVVGYSMQEYGELDGLYLVRRRHAHAWAQAYVDGAWVDVDTTPAIWAEAEAQESGFFTPVYDRLSWLWAQFSEWRTREREDTGNWLLGGALLVSAWLYWRVFRRPRALQESRAKRAAADAARTSPYFGAETALARAGYPRKPGETPRDWLDRLASDRCPYYTDALRVLVDAHYRYAYRDRADRPALEIQMREFVARWRAEIEIP